MDDRTLLEMAAKAAEIEYDADRSKPHPVSGAWWGLWLVYHREPTDFDRRYWNPLKDDGDALRLAVKLKIDVKHYEDHVVAWFHDYFGTGKIPYDSDPNAATRRAIVLAAAEIELAKSRVSAPGAVEGERN
jgi:hypothetical protein